MTARWKRTIFMVVGALCGFWSGAIFGMLTPQFPRTTPLVLGAAIGAGLGAVWLDRNRIPVFRWVIGVPAALLGWSLGAAAGGLLYTIAEAMCPDEARGFKGCVSLRIQDWQGAANVSGLIIACFLFVLLPAFAVPSRRRTVALIALVVQHATAMGLLRLGAPFPWQMWTILSLSSLAALALVHWVHGLRCAA